MANLHKLTSRETEESANLIALARTGDSEAFGQLVLVHQRSLQQFVARKVRSHEDAADLCQDVLMRAYIKLDRFQGRSTFQTWLLSIARRAIADYYRARIDSQIVDPDGVTIVDAKHDFPHTTRTRNKVPESWETRRLVEHCLECIIRSLSLEQQLAVILCDIYGFSDKETSRLMARTLGAFKHLLHSARWTMDNVSDGKCALVKKTGELLECKLQVNTAKPIPDSEIDERQEPIRSLRTELLREIELSIEARPNASRPLAEKLSLKDGKQNSLEKSPRK